VFGVANWRQCARSNPQLQKQINQYSCMVCKAMRFQLACLEPREILYDYHLHEGQQNVPPSLLHYSNKESGVHNYYSNNVEHLQLSHLLKL
jgi:hypothetical protein